MVHDDLTDTSTSTSVVSKSVSKAFSVCTCIAVEPCKRLDTMLRLVSVLASGTAYLAKFRKSVGHLSLRTKQQVLLFSRLLELAPKLIFRRD